MFPDDFCQYVEKDTNTKYTHVDGWGAERNAERKECWLNRDANDLIVGALAQPSEPHQCYK